MRKYISLLLVLVGCVNYAAADSNGVTSGTSDATGLTFFTVRPLYQSAMPEKVTMFRDRALARDCGYEGALDVTVFGGRSTRSKDLGKYFMYCFQNTLTADSNNADLARGINPLHFNIQYCTDDYACAAGTLADADTFSSTIEFKPRQSVAGLGLTYRQYVGWNECCEPVWWFEAGFPIYHVRNNMNLTETTPVTEGTQRSGSAANMIEAFAGTTTYLNGQSWKYGKIDGSRSKTGVAEIELKLGYDYVNCETCHFDGYFGVLVPTSNKPKSVYVFEPITGHNRHAGLMLGGTLAYVLWEGCDRSIYFAMDTNSRYLFRNTQVRSFDLKYRPWSRYMLTIPDAAAAESIAGATSLQAALAFAAPGINIFTQKVRVHPRFEFDINSAFVYDSACGFHAEVGVNFWARQAEKVTLADNWVEGPAILNLDPAAYTGAADAAIVNRLSNIGNDNRGGGLPYVTTASGSAETATVIREQDLNLQSAAHPATMSHALFLTAGYNWDDYCYPMYTGIGGSYEFSAVNTAINRWTFWGKFGVSI